MSPMQRCFSDLVCQPLVKSCVIDAYLCLANVARLDPGVPAYDALPRMVDTYTKAESQWPAGEDRRVTLATFGSTSPGGCQRPTAIYVVEI